MNLSMAAYAVIVYAVLTAAGGLAGYLKAKSRPSLIAGGASGAIMLICGVLMLKGIFPAAYAALLVALGLTVVFTKRFSAKRAFMPTGLMLALSILISVVLITAVAWHHLFDTRV